MMSQNGNSECENKDIQHVFIVGCKGIPANYGGFETFVDKLTEHNDNSKIKYHVACMGEKEGSFEYHGASCFKVKVFNVKSATAILYDVKALRKVCDYIRENNIKNPIVYILACRIGPYISCFKKEIHSLGGKLYLNPDGHEWKRAKWSTIVKLYWRLSERAMVKCADKIICDSKNIEKYIKRAYGRFNPDTCYISYGAELGACKQTNEAKLKKWFADKKIKADNYYLIVGRFVPENNFETIIKEFMKSSTKKDLVIITTANVKFLRKLEKTLHFKSDDRIKFVGTVYDQELLLDIRKNAYAYIHGHEVGGTNPSLLEALGCTKINMLYKVGFNHEVAEGAAMYWDKSDGNLARLIYKCDTLSEEEIKELEAKAQKRISDKYSWERIVNQYCKVFLS